MVDSFDEWVEKVANRITREIRESVKRVLKSIPPERVKSVIIEFCGEIPSEQLKKVLDTREPMELAKWGPVHVSVPDLGGENAPELLEFPPDLIDDEDIFLQTFSRHFEFGPPKLGIALKIITALGGKLVGVERSAKGSDTYEVTVSTRYQMPTLGSADRLFELMQFLEELPEEGLGGLEGLTHEELAGEIARRAILSRVVKEE
ncbi:MAG: hypothetical protein QXR87_04660 [Candidatus Hadarchaeales archaeon]